MNDRKPLREWLLARHASESAQLDAIRARALAPQAESLADVFRAALLPDRRFWQLLAAVWVGLLAFQAVTLQRRPARSATPPATASLAPWFNQLKSDAVFAQTYRRP